MSRIASSDFKPEIDRLRGLAILLVVVSHALAISKGTPVGEALYTTTRGATWIFVFISGFLFAHLQSRYTFLGYLKVKLDNVVAPYLVVASVILMTGLTRLDATSARDLLNYYALGHPIASPLWFMPMIFLIYLGFPIYRHLCKKADHLAITTVLSIIFAMAVGRPFFDEGPLANLFYFQSAFLFGIFYRNYQDRLENFIAKHFTLIVLGLIVGVNLGMGPTAPLARGQIFALLPLTVLLVPALQINSSLNTVWEWLSSRSFGIFFLHGVVTDLMVAQLGSHQSFLLALVSGIAITFACGSLISLVRYLVGSRSRLLIGA